MLHHTWSNLDQETPASESRSSSFGAPPVLDVCSSRTSACPRQASYTCTGFHANQDIRVQTKGLSLEQIDILYQNTTPMKSVEYRRMLQESGQQLGAGTGEKPELHDDGSDKV